MEYQEIKRLLEKYWAAETSLEEEAVLTEYFTAGPVAAELETYRPLFDLYVSQQDLVPTDNLEQSIRQVMEQEAASTRKAPLIRLVPAMRVAAIVLVMLGAATTFRYLQRDRTRTSVQPVVTDTYDDPQVAMEEVQKALKLVAGKMHQGEEITAEKLTNLNTLDKVLQ